MIDLSDLRSLEICKKCKRVYMPDFKEGMDYAKTPFAINIELCRVCEKKSTTDKEE